MVANGGGSFDLTGLFMQSSGGSTTTEINPGSAVLGVGDLGFTDDVWANSGSEGPGLIGPGSYGSGGTADPSSGISPDFVFYEGNVLLLPHGYVSGTAFSDSSTYTGATFSSLGLTSGTYTWTWDAGADSLVLNVPEPASLTLLGAGMLGLLAVRRSRAAARKG